MTGSKLTVMIWKSEYTPSIAYPNCGKCTAGGRTHAEASMAFLTACLSLNSFNRTLRHNGSVTDTCNLPLTLHCCLLNSICTIYVYLFWHGLQRMLSLLYASSPNVLRIALLLFLPLRLLPIQLILHHFGIACKRQSICACWPDMLDIPMLLLLWFRPLPVHLYFFSFCMCLQKKAMSPHALCQASQCFLVLPCRLLPSQQAICMW